MLKNTKTRIIFTHPREELLSLIASLEATLEEELDAHKVGWMFTIVRWIGTTTKQCCGSGICDPVSGAFLTPGSGKDRKKRRFKVCQKTYNNILYRISWLGIKISKK